PVGGTQTGADSGVTEIDIRKIEPNRNQPRQYFDEAALDELADSIRTYGIIQPLILKDCGDYYNIIAGERRFRAARRANLDAVPAIVKDYTELETLQVALIENIQRQDLTPIEEALCYKRLMDDFFFSQEDIAAKVSKGRAAISSALRLLELDVRVQELVAASRLTVSHAKALLGIKDGDRQFEAAEHVAEDDLSVRATENLVAEILAEPQEAPMEPPAKEPEFIQNPEVAAAYRHAEEELMTLLGAKVNILQGKKKGKIEIEYYSPDELDRLLGLFKIKMTEEISEGE
ncbi:MAG: ParB/RepB/Spo0J family partition protein, partial [Defluviitaleaceae bacterium]|nr:ParB/RepB/Spo0J family partition protein [Defluviitaleaceae bacterium]